MISHYALQYDKVHFETQLAKALARSIFTSTTKQGTKYPADLEDVSRCFKAK
jgi:hypothetical protein